MVLLRQAKPKRVSGGFNRLFDNEELSDLLSKVQSTLISNGNELERIITRQISSEGRFLEDYKEYNISSKAYLVNHKSFKIDVFKRDKPNFILFAERKCYLVQISDTYVFDRKKCEIEKKYLENFKKELSKRIDLNIEYYFCCFNNNNKEEIADGLKNVFTEDEILGGAEFCEILNVDYEKIKSDRLKECPDNLSYFLEKLLEIDVVREKLYEML